MSRVPWAWTIIEAPDRHRSVVTTRRVGAHPDRSATLTAYERDEWWTRRLTPTYRPPVPPMYVVAQVPPLPSTWSTRVRSSTVPPLGLRCRRVHSCLPRTGS